MPSNKAIIFKQVPHGAPVEGQDLAVEPFEIDFSKAPEGGILLKNYYLSYDPYMRGKMRAPEKKSYSPPFTLGQPLDTRGIAKVLKSDSKDFKEGDLVIGYGIQMGEYATIPKSYISMVSKLDVKHELDPVLYLGPLGMPGLTAWSSLYEIGEPKKGETIFVSSAAGAVGQLVGQIAKHEGLRVIGSVGTDEKLEFITKELGFDAGFNYKKEKVLDALKRLAPDGIDIYYENVGGEHLEAALESLKQHGRIVVCGMISQYNATAETAYPIRNMTNVIGKRLKMQGFIVTDIGARHTAKHQESVSKWLADGSFKAKIDTVEGIDNGAKGMIGILEGKNFGKAVLKVADIE